MRNKKKSKKNRKSTQRKPGFVIFAEKLMENLKFLNEINECPNCKRIIENNEKICPICGMELKTKTIEENMEYIRGYLEDVFHSQNEKIRNLSHELKRFREIIRDLKLKLGYEICPICSGEGSQTVMTTNVFAFNPNIKTTQYCENCNGEGVIK
jgi:RNA polymerase subunit RPABC4/transcription elongation factor Spt4